MKKAIALVCVLLAVNSFAQQFTPVAYWEFQHPEPQGNNLRDVKMIDSLTYVAVGDQGTVVRTFDDGVSWKVTTKLLGSTANLVSVDFGTGNTGVAVGGTSIFFTNDTGHTWRRTSAPNSATLYRVHYVSASRVFCVGKDGAIALSIDSGKSWKSIVLETNDDMRDIDFNSPSYGIICATNGVRYITRDSGKIWSLFTDNSANSLFSLDFINGKDGVMCGEFGSIYLTKDSAKSWQMQDIHPNGNTNDVVMLSSQKILVACDRRAVYKTTNGGTTWANAEPFGTASLKSISFAADLKNGVIVGSNGIIMRTYNGADSWEVVFDRVVSDPVGLNSVYAIDSMTVVAAGSAGLIVRTTDGGKVWKEVPTTITGSLYDIDFQTPLVGTAVGDYGTILRTHDAGKTWVPQPSNSSADLRGVDFLDTSNGVACGSKGIVLMTQNGGSTWFNITGNPDTLSFRDVAYVSPDRIVIVGTRSRKAIDPALLNQGHIVISDDNGFSWKQAPISGVVTDMSFNEGYTLSFPTPAVGYAAGSSGEGSTRQGPWARTLDSGSTWMLMDSAMKHPVYGMSFANRYSGTAVGIDGRTSHTSNGGASWVEVNSGTALTMNAVHHPTLQTAFGVGLKTAIIRLTTNDTIVTLSAPRTPVMKTHDILRSVYPNPASELATFEIGIERTMTVTLSLFDVKGNKVASIYDGILPNGVHEANLDVSKLTAGIYFARLDSPDGSEMMKVIIQ
ncbi:MAG TPA: YCF48-related protein [Candidatus Kapabacteria bacterium]